MTLRVRWLGRVPYREALDLQHALFESAASDQLLLLEHPPVYTLGVRATTEHILTPPASVGRPDTPPSRCCSSHRAVR